ncbi:MAG TPA: TAXI family TRAP transporter solute-binding subunit [Beijerinckiaceae bacterium]|nr:TAXI family TRAP transporter solute-binding subunit [Beijerinckiaceae bacterium]
MRLTARLLLAATAIATSLGIAAAQDLRMMTGPQGGIWVPLGGQLKDLWEKAIPGARFSTLPGAGIANARAIEESKADVGFGNSITTADAIAGNAPFEKKHGKICNVASLYPQFFQAIVLADSGINSIKDLKGKTITTQQRGNTGELITQNFLKAYGMSYSDVKVNFGSYTESVEQMKDKQAQLFTLGAGAPLGAVMDLASARDIRLLDQTEAIDAMRQINPGYVLLPIAKGTYPKQDKDVNVIAYATHVIVSCALPSDTVYQMTKAIADNTALLGNLNKDMGRLSPKEMAASVGVPFHPGAARFYAEKGIALQ